MDGARTSIEETLASIWKTVLEKDQVGVDDNFFAIGASSLEAVIACSFISERLGAELSIADMFKYPTIRTLAERVRSISASKEMSGAT